MQAPTLLRVYQSRDPAAAVRAVFDAFQPDLPLRAVSWICSDQRSVQACWPEPAAISDELVQAALGMIRPEVFPLGSEFPTDAARHPGSEALLLPLGDREQGCGVAVMIAPVGAFGDELERWAALATALARIVQEARNREKSVQEVRTLRQRVEEAEALHTLGLATNRTLNPDEVLNLVARFARALLGAHYVIVHTMDAGQSHAMASVGLRDADGARRDYLFARKVVEAGRPLTIGAEDSPHRVGDFPFHQAEGMKAGLGLPLSLFGDTFGALVVGYRRAYTPTARDIRLALTLAGHAAVAISNARLHRALGERSEELERAYAELERTTQLKERFFASLSHELRTPINGILGYQQLLSEGVGGELPPAARTFVDKASRAAHNLLGLVNDLLDYAKLEAGQMTFNWEDVPVRAILDDAVANVEPLAGQRHLRLSVDAGHTAGPLHTDADRVRQILVNLLSNAIKFTPENGEVSLLADDRVGWVELRVRDTGPGIPRESQEAIFREFEQVAGTRGGTGLGLPISRKMAQLLGGDLCVESEPGHGSTFILRLPASGQAGGGETAVQV